MKKKESRIKKFIKKIRKKINMVIQESLNSDIFNWNAGYLVGFALLILTFLTGDVTLTLSLPNIYEIATVFGAGLFVGAVGWPLFQDFF